MDQEQALELLLDRTARIEAGVTAIQSELATTKAGLKELKAALRDNVEITLSYRSHVEPLLTAVTRRYLSLEERVDVLMPQVDDLLMRIERLEKRNPAA